MQPESLEVLEKADVPPAQARAIVRAIEIEIVGAKDTLATKHDILLLRQEMAGQASTLRTEMAGLRADVGGGIVELGAALRGEIAALTATLRGEMSDMRGELRAEIHRTVSGVTRQMYTALLGQMAVLLGFAYFFATNIVR